MDNWVGSDGPTSSNDRARFDSLTRVDNRAMSDGPPADSSEDPDGGPTSCKTEQGAGDEEGLPAEERVTTGSYRWDGGTLLDLQKGNRLCMAWRNAS